MIRNRRETLTATALVAGETGAIESVSALLDFLCPRHIRVGAVGAPNDRSVLRHWQPQQRSCASWQLVFADPQRRPARFRFLADSSPKSACLVLVRVPVP